MAGSIYGKIKSGIHRIAKWRSYDSEKFWTLEKRIRQDKKACGVQCDMSRSNQFNIMVSLLFEGAITFDDLEEFSDDLKNGIKSLVER